MYNNAKVMMEIRMAHQTWQFLTNIKSPLSRDANRLKNNPGKIARPSWVLAILLFRQPVQTKPRSFMTSIFA